MRTEAAWWIGGGARESGARVGSNSIKEEVRCWRGVVMVAEICSCQQARGAAGKGRQSRGGGVSEGGCEGGQVKPEYRILRRIGTWSE